MATLQQPQDLEAEKQLLGACLLDKKVAEKTREVLSPEDFYLSGHGEIFEAINHLLSTNKVPDIITVVDYLRNKGRLEAIGGVVYVASLPNLVASTEFAGQHSKIVELKSFARKILSISERVKAKAYNGDYETPTELLTYAESELATAEPKDTKGGLEHIGIGLKETMLEIEGRWRRKSISGIPTGFGELTAWLAGYQRRDLILLAARPSMGKTTFAVQEAKNMAIKYGMKSAIFSMEMSRRQLVEKLLINEGMISAQNVRVGKLTEVDWDKMSEAASRLLQAGVYIDDTSRLTTMDMAHRCRRLKAKHGLDMVFIDYLGFIRPTKRAERRQLEVGEMTKDLKSLAKELNIPIMLLCQLNRDCESRPNKRPVLSDLRESGDLEQDADVVMFLYRDEYYNKDSEKKGMAEIILAKQRNGPTGSMEVSFLKECTKFGDIK